MTGINSETKECLKVNVGKSKDHGFYIFSREKRWGVRVFVVTAGNVSVDAENVVLKGAEGNEKSALKKHKYRNEREIGNRKNWVARCGKALSGIRNSDS